MTTTRNSKLIGSIASEKRVKKNGQVVRVTRSIHLSEQAVMKELAKLDVRFRMNRVQSDDKFDKFIQDRSRSQMPSWADKLKHGLEQQIERDDVTNSLNRFIADSSYKSSSRGLTMLVTFYSDYEDYCFEHGMLPLTPQQVCYQLGQVLGVEVKIKEPESEWSTTSIGLLKANRQ